MKITRIRVYRTELPYVGGTYVWGAGNAISTARASVVVIDTDAGLRGCGEFTPCGENYMVAHSEGVEAAARLIAPALLGQDPRQVARIERLMDDVIQGHGYAKAPFDAACWDILGQAAGQPVWMLLGGKLTPAAPMYRVAPQKPVDETIAEMETYRAQGYRQFQIKVGGDWSEDIDRIRAAQPDIAMSGDFIVGFPGETDADFDDTMRIVRDVGYAQAFSFKYSPRPGTPGAELDGQVGEAVKADRLQALQDLLTSQQQAFARDCVGRTIGLLIEKPGRNPGQRVGRSPWLQPVIVDEKAGEIGDIVQVRITSAGPNSLFAEPA